MKRKDEFELREVGFDRRLHIGILQFGGKLAAIVRCGTMDLAE